MADHIISFNETEEAIYQKYLVAIGKTDAQVMNAIENDFKNQVIQFIKEAGHTKFDALDVAEQIAFLES